MQVKISNRISEIEQLYVDGFGMAAVDTEMKRFDLRDDDERADGASTMNVSNFGPLAPHSAIE